jgi:hypothetical protein
VANLPEYQCTECGATPGRDNLFVKRVQFQTMGEGARTIKSRVVDWLCSRCISQDVDYNREAFAPKKVQRLG